MKDAKRNSATVDPETDWGYTPHEHEELLRMAEERRKALQLLYQSTENASVVALYEKTGRRVVAIFDQARIVARAWPASENRIVMAELTY